MNHVHEGLHEGLHEGQCHYRLFHVFLCHNRPPGGTTLVLSLFEIEIKLNTGISCSIFW